MVPLLQSKAAHDCQHDHFNISTFQDTNAFEIARAPCFLM
jgi:hypothetical protein